MNEEEQRQEALDELFSLDAPTEREKARLEKKREKARLKAEKKKQHQKELVTGIQTPDQLMKAELVPETQRTEMVT